MSERRNGTRRLYRARPEGLAELKAFLDEFWGDRLEALKREAEREERKTAWKGRLRRSRSSARSRSRRARRPSGSSSSTRRRRSAGWAARPSSTPGRAALYRIEVRPRPRRARRVRRARPAAPARLHVGLGAGRRRRRASCRPGSSTIEIELTPRGDGTLLRFSHRDLPTGESAESHARGWDHYLAAARHRRRRRRPGPRPVGGRTCNDLATPEPARSGDRDNRHPSTRKEHRMAYPFFTSRSLGKDRASSIRSTANSSTGRRGRWRR